MQRHPWPGVRLRANRGRGPPSVHPFPDYAGARPRPEKDVPAVLDTVSSHQRSNQPAGRACPGSDASGPWVLAEAPRVACGQRNRERRTASLPPQWPRHRHICDGSEGLRHCVARMGACGCCCPSCAVRAPGDPAHAQERVLCSASTPPRQPLGDDIGPLTVRRWARHKSLTRPASPSEAEHQRPSRSPCGGAGRSFSDTVNGPRMAAADVIRPLSIADEVGLEAVSPAMLSLAWTVTQPVRPGVMPDGLFAGCQAVFHATAKPTERPMAVK
jgi:hypothetical protein